MNFADSPWNEPLAPFIEGPHEQRSQGRQDEDRRIVPHPPGLIETERQQSVFDEVEPLNRIDLCIASTDGRGISRAQPDRGREKEKPHPASSQACDRDGKPDRDEHDDDAVDDGGISRRKHAANRSPEFTNEWGPQDDRSG